MRINSNMVRALAASFALVVTLTACGDNGSDVDSNYLQLSELEQIECTPSNSSVVKAELEEAADYVATVAKEASSKTFEDILVLNPGETDLDALKEALKFKLADCAAVPATPAPSTSPSVVPTLSEKEVVVAQAKTWTREIVMNFEGATTVPEACMNAIFLVNLTDSESYYNRGGKESPGAFGPAMGENPCEVSKKLVEMCFRDAAWCLEQYNLIALADKKSGFKPTPAADRAKLIVALENGPYQDRIEIADDVLGWYAVSEHEHSLVPEDGAYTSNTMHDDGTVTVSHGNKPSLVLETRDRATDKVVKKGRTDCGLQDYKKGVPPGYEVPPPGKELPPKKLSPKKAEDHPANTGNAPADKWEPAEEIDTTKEPATKPGGGTPPKTYTVAPKPTPKPTPRSSTPPPPPPPDPEPTEAIPTPTTGCDPNNPLCDE